MNFEFIYNFLTKSLIEELPDFIGKINQKHNDGIFIAPLNKAESKLKPYFEINFETAEKTEKDILIENEVYNVSIELHLNEQDKDCKVKFWRYVEAIEEMISFYNKNFYLCINKISNNKISIKIII